MKLKGIICGLLVAATGVVSAGEAKKTKVKPAVLFTSGVHVKYFAQPLYAEGIEIHTCSPQDLPEKLASWKYNVVVVTGGLHDEKIVTALKTFMNAGGGVLLMPTHKHYIEGYLANAKFIETYGARYALVVIEERDPAKRVGSFQSTLQFTDNINPDFKQDVEGLLYHYSPNHEGVSAPIDLMLDKNWNWVVKASPTAEAVPYTQENVTALKPFVPEKSRMAPTLLAVRDVGKGRLAVITITPEWSFAAPKNCPPVEDMMTRGCGGRPSKWVRLFANTFQYLAEPSLTMGKGSTPTQTETINPPFKPHPLHPVRDWTKAPLIKDQDQLIGLIGARSSHSSGKATVAEWVKVAKAEGLDYLVFLEPLEFIDKESFDKFKTECAVNTDENFFACPGIWGKDIYGTNAMFMYGERAEYPQQKNLTEDSKFFNNSEGLPKKTRTGYIFDYFFEQLGYAAQFGFFRHAENSVPVWEYKMNHVFPIFSTENGKPLDNAFDEFAFLQAQQFHYHPAAFSLMDDPSQIARALKQDWITINTAPGEFGDGSYTQEYGQGIAAMRKLFSEQVAWLRPFQYITQGPRILCWRGRWEVVVPYGEWFRPDLWRYQTRLHVKSDASLKEIKIMSNGRVIRRFLLNGAKEFDRTFEWENSVQRALYPVIEDVNGKKAIGSYIRNSNTMWNEFICGDRCNYLSYGTGRTKEGKAFFFKSGTGNGITHNKGGWYGTVAPAQTLTLDYPTLPIDGQGGGERTPWYEFAPVIDTEGYPPVNHINCKPKFVMAGPDLCIGGGYVDNVIVDPSAWGNAWSWWSAIKPNEFIKGFGLTTLFNYYPGGIRPGWYKFCLTTRKDIALQGKAMPVRFVSANITEIRDGIGEVYKAGDKDMPASGSFKTGAYVLTDSIGGPAGLVSLSDNLVFRSGQIGINPHVVGNTIPKGTVLNGKIGFLGAPAGTPISKLAEYINALGNGLPQIRMNQGTKTTDHVAVHFDAQNKGVDFRAPSLGLVAYVPMLVENLNQNWDAWLLDRTRGTPNWRQLEMLESTAYAAIPGDVELNLFMGHPVVADNPDVVISICNLVPGKWQVTVHNPTDKARKTTVRSVPNWTPFKLKPRMVEVAAGSSVDIAIE